MTQYMRTAALVALGILAISASACNKEPVATASPSGRTVSAEAPAISGATMAPGTKGTRVMTRKAGPMGAPPMPQIPTGAAKK